MCYVPVVYDERAGGGHVFGSWPCERHSTREVSAPLQILNLVGKQIAWEMDKHFIQYEQCVKIKYSGSQKSKTTSGTTHYFLRSHLNSFSPVQFTSSLWSEQSKKPSHLSVLRTQVSPSAQRVAFTQTNDPLVAAKRGRCVNLLVQAIAVYVFQKHLRQLASSDPSWQCRCPSQRFQ